MYKNKRVNAITSKVVKFLLGASGFLLLGSGILLGTQANSDPGLVLHYDFEDASNLGKDSSGKGNHGTNHGVTQVAGRVGKSANFNGVDQMMDLSQHASKLALSKGTISFWAKVENDNFNPILQYSDHEDGRHYAGWSLGDMTGLYSDEDFSFIHWTHRGDTIQHYQIYTRSSPSRLNNEWHHYLMTSDEAGNVKVFIDGVQETTFPGGQPSNRSNTFMQENSNKIWLGKSMYITHGNIPPFKGQIDELKIWNYELTPSQIQAEYDRAPKQELVLHYDFEDASNLGKDSSGKGNHGTNHNTTQTEGRVGKAGKFNGTSSYLTVPMNQSLKFPVQHSIGAWVKLNRAPQFDTAIIASWVGAYYMSICQDTNAFCTFWYEKILDESYKNVNQTMPLNTWVYLTTVWGDRTLDMYINGQKVKSFPTNLYGSNDSGIDKLLIAGGETWNGLNRFLDGQIDDLKIWNYALSPQEVQAQYRAHTEPTVLITMQSDRGEILGTQKLTATAQGQAFQIGSSYEISAPQLADRALQMRFTTAEPQRQSVAFTADATFHEITFVYSKPELVLHYTFDEEVSQKVIDKSGNENHGTIIGNPQWDDWGRVGGMLTDTGLRTHKGLGIGDSAAFTIAGWIKTNTNHTHNYFITNALGGNGYRFGIWEGKVAFLIGNNDNQNPSRYTETICGTSIINDNQWHHIVGTFNLQGKRVDCYVDGNYEGYINLPEHYQNRFDGAPYIGDTSRVKGTFWTEGAIDDIRVYNFALTAQAVKSLYQSYPAEVQTPLELELTANKTENILVADPFVITTSITVRKPTKNLVLKMFLSDKLTFTEQFTAGQGIDFLSGEITKTTVGSGQIFTVPIRSDFQGAINGKLVSTYRRDVTPHEWQENIKAELFKREQNVLSTGLALQVWNPLILYNPSLAQSSKVGNGFDIHYNYRLQIDTRNVHGNQYFDRYRPGDLVNLIGTIPLPPQARVKSIGHPNMRYDQSKHALILEYPRFGGYIWNLSHTFVLQYTGLNVGDEVNAPAAVFTGFEGTIDGPQRVYTLPRKGVARVEASKIEVDAGLHVPQGSGIIDETEQQLVGVNFVNIGNTIANNMQIELTFPDGMEAYSIHLPTSFSAHIEHPANLFQPLNFNYETNKGKQGQVLGNFNQRYGRQDLGLDADEYFTKVIFWKDSVHPGESVSRAAHYVDHGIRIRGDIKSHFKDGTPLTSSTPLIVNGKLKIDGTEDKILNLTVPLTTVSYRPLHISTYANKVNLLQGDEIRIHGWYGHGVSYNYGNGHTIINPSLFILLPEGFELLPESFESANATSPRLVTNARNPQGKTIWRVDYTNKGSWHWPAYPYSFKIRAKNDVLPQTYNIRPLVVMGSDNPKYQVTSSYGMSSAVDSYGLWGTNANNTIVRGGEDAYSSPLLTVTANKFGAGNACLKAGKDTLCKSSFSEDALITFSNYPSGGTGHYTAKLYNGSLAEINNIHYTIRLPQLNQTTKTAKSSNQWEFAAIKQMTAIPGATIWYGMSEANLSQSFIPGAKIVQIRIPSMAPQATLEFKLEMTAPTFGSEDTMKTAFLLTDYTIGSSSAEPVPVMFAGLRLVGDDFREGDDVFCQAQQLWQNQNPTQSNVNFHQCKALIEWYKESNKKATWTRFEGWKVAGTQVKNFGGALNICSWYGITCNEGKIIAINLEGNNLQGQIPASFKALTDLTSLNLSKNPITGFDRALQPLTQLKTLNLSETKVVSFAHLPSNLTHLILNKLALPAKTNLPNLPQLQYLDMSETTWDMDNAKSLQGLVDSFSHLQEWNMSKAAWQNSNLPTFPERIGNLTQLRVLNWKGSKILGKIPASLNDLIKLEHFDVSENYLTDPLPNFDWSALSKLTTFDIRNNYIGGLNTKANPLTNKWRAFKPREQWQLIITQGGQRKTEIHDLSADASESVVVKQAQRRDAESLKDAHYDLPSDLRAKLLVRQDPSNVFDIQATAPNYTVRFANGVPKSGRLTIGVTNHLDSQGMKASLVLYPSAEALEQEEKKQRTRDDNASATQGRLNFDLKGAFLDKSFSAVHFNVGGDDFGGGIFWQRSEDLDSPVYLNYGSETLSCLTQLKGFYYNSQRGERLWPLDQTSLAKLQAELADKYEGWTVEGGWYTDCYKEGQNAEQDQRGTAIYGVIKHLKDNDLKYTLVAGAQYDYQQETMESTPKCNLQMLNNAYPFGYLYDTAGGLATLGMRINSHQIKSAYDTVIAFHQKLLNELNGDACVNEFFDHDGENLIMKGNRLGLQLGDGFLSLGVGDAREILFKLGILGIIGLSDELRSEDKRAIEGNSADASLLLNTDNSIASVINIATKKADELCRDKWIDVSQTQPLNGSVLCLDAANAANATISLGSTQYAGKTIIVKNGNLILNSYMASTDQPTTIFVAKGNLFLPQGTQSNPQHLIDFSPSGYPTAPGDASSSKAYYLKGNFIVNGLILGGAPGDRSHAIYNKLIIHGKVASYNMISTPKNIQILDAKKTTLKRILGDAIDPYLNYLGLDRIFVWSCDVVKGAGSDGTPCKGKQGAFMTDKAFGLIDMTFLSPLFL